MGKRTVRVRRLNWDAECYADLQTGIGFIIDEPSGISIDGVKKKSLHGALSPLYGTTYEDEHAFIERYRCGCTGDAGLRGKLHEGEVCPICGQKVEYKPNDVNITGWISLGKEKCINPYWYNILQNAIGKAVFEEMVIPKSIVNTDGQRTRLTAENLEDTVPLSDFSFIGINEFYDRYEEIIKYFAKKKKNKKEVFDNLLKSKDCVFTSHIPIYTTMLRPQSITSDTFYFGKIDKLINTLYKLSEMIKDCNPIDKDEISKRIQIKVNRMWDHNLEMINGKQGWIRDQILGGSLNFTSRNVIIPDPALHDNEVTLSYNAALELLKYPTIKYIRKLDNCSINEARREWEEAHNKFSKKVYEVMMYVVHTDKPMLLINRNPTLNYYSMLRMKIGHINTDIYNFTLSVPLSILAGLNADFDGDILNIIILCDKSLVYMFRKFDPVSRMIISRDTGLLNDYFSITKGQLIDLYAFASYDGEDDCNTPQTYPEEEVKLKDGFDLRKDIPVINNTNDLKKWLKPTFIISEYFTSKDKYNDFLNEIYNLMKACFVIKECRNYDIKFKFYKDDKKIYHLPFKMFLINVMLWYPLVEISDLKVFTRDFIMEDPEKIPRVEDYINEYLITTLREYHIPSSKMNIDICKVLYNLRSISINFSILIGLDFSAPLFIDLYNNNEEIRSMMECTFKETDQPHDVEQKLNQYENRLVELVTQIPDNHLGIALRAKTGIKTKQLREFCIAEGLKPDLTGKTLPVIVDNSTMIRGADKPSSLFADAMGSRKSLVMNKKVMGNAGYFGKIVLMSTRTLSMSTKVSDCGTKHLVRYNIESKAHLKKLSGKYYRLTNNPREELKILKQTDTDLIGKTIYVRSAATCALKNHVCPKCVGQTAITNEDIADGLSAFESEEITKVVNQNILSAKHLLSTNSEVIKFNSEFYKFFTIIGGEINPIVNDNKDVPNIEDYAIYINPEDISKVDELDDDSLFNTFINNGRFYIRNLTNPDEEDIVIQANDEKEIYISEETSAMLRKNNNIIPFSKLDDDTKLFEMVIMNNELTRPLYSLMDLLNKQNKDGINETIDSMCNKLLGLIIEAKISASAVACELIINRLIRKADNIYERPDFSKDDIGDYTILTVTKSLEKNSSPLMGLSFQNIKRQILSEDMFNKRKDTSYIDSFYKTEIPTDNLTKYAKYQREEEKHNAKLK